MAVTTQVHLAALQECYYIAQRAGLSTKALAKRLAKLMTQSSVTHRVPFIADRTKA